MSNVPSTSQCAGRESGALSFCELLRAKPPRAAIADALRAMPAR